MVVAGGDGPSQSMGEEVMLNESLQTYGEFRRLRL